MLARASRFGAWLRSTGGIDGAGARVGLVTPNCVPAIECHYAIAGWAGGSRLLADVHALSLGRGDWTRSRSSALRAQSLSDAMCGLCEL